MPDTGTLLLAVIALLVFLVVRDIVTWYFKINQVVSLLTSIDGKLGPKPPAP